MEVILILRTEIVCFILLLFLLLYSKLYSMANGITFRRICHIAMYHVIFDAVTVCTVNKTWNVPEWLNHILHAIMYTFAIWFCCEVVCYVLRKIPPHVKRIRITRLIHIPVLIYFICSPFMNISYACGRGTYYSCGTAVYAGYILAGVYVLTCILLLLIWINRLNKATIFSMLPTCIIMLASIVLQIIFPELLITGAQITLVTMGIFFNVENPVAYLRQRAYVDTDTGIKNRNCYDEEKSILNDLYFGKNPRNEGKIAAIVFDVNGLKRTNDTYGHAEGDLLIRSVADNLSKNLSSAYNIYRTGGDEFIAIYLGKEVSKMQQEISKVRAGCKEYYNLKESMSIAIGSATWEDDNFTDITQLISFADKKMYEQKNEEKHNTDEKNESVENG